MLSRKIYRAVQTYVTAIAVIVTVVALVFTIYFTELNMQWATFLTGILIASMLAMTTRASHAEWIVTRRTAQLTSIRNKLGQEVQLRNKTIADHQQSLALLQQNELAYGRLIPQPDAHLAGMGQHR